MNKLYFLSLPLVLSISGFAQFNKGALLAGGQFSITNANQTYNGRDYKSTTANIELSLGKAIRENQVFGLSLGYSPIRQYDQDQYVDLADVKSDR